MSENDSLLESKKIGFTYNPKDITLKDDAFHDSKSLFFTEWWYFDATLNDGYAAQINVRIASALKKTIFQIHLRFELFKDGIRIAYNKKVFKKDDFETSNEKPYIKLGGKEIINARIDKKTDNMIFDIFVDLNNTQANLQFEGITKGYKGKSGIPRGLKGKTKEGGWAVILPRAKVKGKIKINDKEINVTGIGYHDHNWDVKIPIILNYGWLWGKIYFKNSTVVWAKVFETQKIASPLCLISINENGYINIKPEDIQLIAKDFKIVEKKLLPHFLNLKAKNEKVDLNIKMKVLEIDFERVMGFMNYFRYHTKCSGQIKINKKEEKVDGNFIAEFLRFG